MQNKTLWVVGSLLIGFLQAWDSGALQAGALAQALIVAGVLAPALSIAASERFAVRVVALVAAAVLLAGARMAAPVSLNTLHIGLFVPAMFILFVSGWLDRRSATSHV
jgi:hypothetical protein